MIARSNPPVRSVRMRTPVAPGTSFVNSLLPVASACAMRPPVPNLPCSVVRTTIMAVLPPANIESSRPRTNHDTAQTRKEINAPDHTGCGRFDEGAGTATPTTPTWVAPGHSFRPDLTALQRFEAVHAPAGAEIRRIRVRWSALRRLDSPKIRTYDLII